MYLFDTNIVSDLRRPGIGKFETSLSLWAKGVGQSRTFLSVVSLLEIERGVLLLARRDKPQAEMLRDWFETGVKLSFEGRILSVTSAVALRAAALHVPDPKLERDCFIAATALVHGMTVVTRDVRDFVPMGVPILNPWLA